MTINNHIFVAMPFGQKKAQGKSYNIDFDLIYNNAIKPAAEELGLNIIRADEESDSGIIHALMIERLICTDIVIVDITNENPNVYYELGIRHCARPYSTILIYDKKTKIPFDIQPLRAIPYELERGIISEASAELLKKGIVERIRYSLQYGFHCDSLPFALIEDFPRKDLNPEKLSIYKQMHKQRTIFKNQIEDINNIDKLKTIIAEIDNIHFPYKYLIYELIEGFRKIKAWDELINFIENNIDEELKNTIYVKQQYALAYNKRNRINDELNAIRILKSIINNYGESAETYGLLGGAYKSLALKQTTNSVPYNSYIDHAIENYRNGFVFDSREYYPGINLATLLLLKNTTDSISELKRILPVICYNIELNDFTVSNDYWLLASAYELYILMQKFDKAKNILGLISTLDSKPEEWMVETTIRNLTLIKVEYEKHSISVDWYKNFEKLIQNKEI